MVRGREHPQFCPIWEIPLRLPILIVAAGLIASFSSVSAAPLTVDLMPAADNPPAPQMGDNLKFNSAIRNDGATPLDGLIAWILLLEVDKGKEQPIDLEDWSAHKAVTIPRLMPGGTVRTEWPMRLIQSGDYRVAIGVAGRDGSALTPSPLADFTVRQKPVVESQRVLPIAIGVPALLGLSILFGLRRRFF
jgi:hypothetical protein